jgi:hypothetical protein
MENILRITLLVCCLFATACAKNSGIVKVGNNKFMVSRQAATGFSGMTTLEADAMSEAYAECNKANQEVAIISREQSEPPYVFGNFPRVEILFRCVDEP